GQGLGQAVAADRRQDERDGEEVLRYVAPGLLRPARLRRRDRRSQVAACLSQGLRWCGVSESDLDLPAPPDADAADHSGVNCHEIPTLSLAHRKLKRRDVECGCV